MVGAYTRSGLVPGGHTGDQVARRATAIEKIRELLAEKPMSNMDLAVALGIPPRTVYGYLNYLQAVDEAYQLDAPDSRGRKVWVLDDEQESVDAAVAQHAQRAWIVPARQLGMPRDPLVAALFGPTQGAAA